MLKKSLILLFLLVIPLAAAELELEGLSQNVYNLGEKIFLNAYINQNQDVSALLKITLNCGDYDFQYFMTPLSLKANEDKRIEVPSLGADSLMVGICRVKASLESNNGELIESSESGEFEITDKLNVSFETDKEEYNPGETAELKIDIRTKYGYDIEKPAIDLFIGSDKITSFSELKMRYEFQIPESAKAGTQTIKLELEDENGNSGEAGKEIKIKQIPTRIGYKLNEDGFIPGETIEIRPVLYDQSDDIIEAKLSLSIKDPAGVIYTNDVESDRKHSYSFDSYAAPGKYFVIVGYEDIALEKAFEVYEYLNLDISLEGEVVFIKNTGNIAYNDKKSIFINSEEKNYVISKDISLAPGEETQIDISEEVSEGSYNVVIPSYNTNTNEFEEVYMENIPIHDGRSAIKKTGAGLAAVTGAVITVGGLLKPSVAAIMLILVIFSLSVYFYYKGKQEE